MAKILHGVQGVASSNPATPTIEIDHRASRHVGWPFVLGASAAAFAQAVNRHAAGDTLWTVLAPLHGAAELFDAFANTAQA